MSAAVTTRPGSLLRMPLRTRMRQRVRSLMRSTRPISPARRVPMRWAGAELIWRYGRRRTAVSHDVGAGGGADDEVGPRRVGPAGPGDVDVPRTQWPP